MAFGTRGKKKDQGVSIPEAGKWESKVNGHLYTEHSS